VVDPAPKVSYVKREAILATCGLSKTGPLHLNKNVEIVCYVCELGLDEQILSIVILDRFGQCSCAVEDCAHSQNGPMG
jgi:hypothetical protein